MSGDLPVSTLTIRLPDDKHERLKALARTNSISVTLDRSVGLGYLEEARADRQR